MKKIKLEGLELDLFTEKLENGLEIYIVPFKNVNNNHVTFTTKYGSVHNDFIPNGKNKMIKVPGGIAHFLEHKLFEQEDGSDPFTFFSERGADANASTTYYKTTYLFSGTNNLEDNLNYLLDYVQSPYFTNKNVGKEKGIIESEIKMYQDDPFTMLREKSLFNTFVNHPYRFPIIGSIKSINNITKEDLYTCYNTFYHPSNMFVVITGNVNPEILIELIKKNQSAKQFEKAKEIEMKKYKEPYKVFKDYEEIEINNVSIPKFIINYKLDLKRFSKLNKFQFGNYLSILFDIKFGGTSNIVQELKEEKLITEGIYVSSDLVDDFVILSICVECKDYKKVIKRIEEELNDLSITKEEFNRKKKVLLSSIVYGSEKIFSVNSKIMNNIIYYGEVLNDTISEIKKLNIRSMEYVIDNLNLKNKSICIAKGKNN